eukprot:103347-Pyramimonas_sp.AAC.1
MAAAAPQHRLRLAQYNPQALPHKRGLKEILEAMSSAHVISLTGTGQTQEKASHDGSLKELRISMQGYDVYQWPTSASKRTARRRRRQDPAQGTNISTGCMIA